MKTWLYDMMWRSSSNTCLRLMCQLIALPDRSLVLLMKRLSMNRKISKRNFWAIFRAFFRGGKTEYKGGNAIDLVNRIFFTRSHQFIIKFNRDAAGILSAHIQVTSPFPISVSHFTVLGWTFKSLTLILYWLNVVRFPSPLSVKLYLVGNNWETGQPSKKKVMDKHTSVFAKMKDMDLINNDQWSPSIPLFSYQLLSHNTMQELI